MNEIYFNGNRVKDIVIEEEHEEGQSLASGWFETGMVDKIEVEERAGTVSIKHYLKGDLDSERLIHLFKISSMKVMYLTKNTARELSER